MTFRILIALIIAAAVGYFLLGRDGSDADHTTSTDQSADSSAAVPAAPAPTIGLIDDARIAAADTEPGNWLAYGRDYREQRFSPLTQVNRETVKDLGLAWFKELTPRFEIEATPIIVDRTMFFTTSFSVVHAVDALTGDDKWTYDPEVPRDYLRKACCGPVNRGVAVYKGRVYVGTLDGRLVALDAASGTKVWETDTVINRDYSYTSTGAPRAAKGKIFIGNGGAEFGVRGYVSAYDAQSGELAWRFFTVPGDPSKPFEHPEMAEAAATWKGGNWWEIGGGGTVWNSIVYDPEFNSVYIGVGNGAPWTRAIRSPGGGDNLFLSSIVSLDADTGRKKWHYQTTPGDNWDYTSVQDIALADMSIDGVARKVLLQAPKNGFFYVLDRADGKLLRANPFVTTTWATHVDMTTGRPVENPELDYSDEPKWVLPGPLGGHNWQAMSVDEKAGVVYLPAQENALIYSLNKEFKQSGIYKRNPGQTNLGLELGNIAQLVDTPGAPAAHGYLKAFNPVSGEELWSVEHKHYWNGGVMATNGGIVFQGDAMGLFRAFDTRDGKELWSFNAYSSMLAPPVTFEIDGTQYVSIFTGWGGGDHFSGFVNEVASWKYGNRGRLLVFKLGGDAAYSEPPLLDRTIPEQQPVTASADDIKRGEQLYHLNCGTCHGLKVKSDGVMPDLRLMSEGSHQAFQQIVQDGLLAKLGMASFADQLTPEDTTVVHQYIISRATADRAEAAAKAK